MVLTQARLTNSGDCQNTFLRMVFSSLEETSDSHSMMMNLANYHRTFPGVISWKLTPVE